MKYGKLILLFISAWLAACSPQREKIPQPNVLFIAVDDLRPELGCYGQSHIISPNIDKLANSGMAFTNAYCNIPVCGASRASLLTGIRPTANRFVDYNTWANEDVPGAISLPALFKQNGYHTISNGKVFHHKDDLKDSWTDEPWNPAEMSNYLNYQTKLNQDIFSDGTQRGFPYEAGDVADTAYFDGKIASKTIADLKRLKEEGKPFFLAAGFLKPHLPFNAPKKYWNLYPEENIQLPDNYYPPQNAPKAAVHNFGELRSYYSIPKKGPVADSTALNLIRGYYACVSYVDVQIGRVLDALDDLGLAENTIVVLWGDHGWQLGEHSIWCKHANFKTSLNAPLIVRAPGYNDQHRSKALVEFIDIYPTLCELSGLEKPKQLHGKSFVPLLENPDQAWKDRVYSRFIKGESIITDRFLYTEWINQQDSIYASMLYDHQTDPDENKNIVGADGIKDTVQSLHNQLHQHIETDRTYINESQQGG